MKSTKKVLIFSLMLGLIFSNFLFFSKIAKAEDKPDLIVEVLTYRENNNLYAGFPFDGTMFYLRVKNQGTAVAESFEAQVYVIDNNTKNSQCATSQFIESLGAGESVNVDFTHDSYFDCADLENKDYYLKAWVDYNNQIDELDENNNIKETSIFHVWPNIDAPQIDNILVNSLSSSRTKISFIAGGIINPIVRWSTDNDFVVIQSDKKYKNQESVISQSGRWYVILNTVDGGNYHYRILYDDNYYNITTNDRTFKAELLPDFKIDDVYIKKSDTAPYKNYVFVDFTNIGGDSEVTTLSVKVTDLDTGDVYSQNLMSSAGFKSGFQYDIQMNSPLLEKSSGKYRLKAEIDYTHIFDENTENNNTLTETINLVETKPDLTIQDFKFTDLRKDSTGPWAKDWDIQLEFYVTNIGTIKPENDFKLKVTNLSLNNKEIQVETYSKGYFEPNTYRAHVYVVGDIINQNNSFIFGENKIKISVDDDNFVNESNENNNTLTKTINITQEPTLTCTDTDGGKDYYKKGTANGVAYWGQSLPASDLADNCSSSIKVNEMWCDSDGYVHQESYDCPYGCANDACIPKPKTQTPTPPVKSPQIAKRLSGKLLLDVDQGGAIWYVDNENYKRHNVKWNNALLIFQMFALGITDNDLLKIPAKTESIYPDLDTDGDGYKDEHELKNGYSPYNSQSVKFKLDNKVGQRLKGRFLLQVQKQGAIWYVDSNGYRHSVRWNNLKPLFESLALGITNFDLIKIEEE
ncbi:hypothetical protein L6278_01575 [Candidatus Parcubacteria bacterium]|nr:hypothetical protein [Candidatus Parcubacteria bacterium]